MIGVDLSAWAAAFAPSLLSDPPRVFNSSGRPGISSASSAMPFAPPPGSFGSSGDKAASAPGASAAAYEAALSAAAEDSTAAEASAAATASTAAAASAAAASAAATSATSAANTRPRLSPCTRACEGRRPSRWPRRNRWRGAAKFPAPSPQGRGHGPPH